MLDSTHILKVDSSADTTRIIPMVQRRTIFSSTGSNSSRIMAYRRLSKLEQEANAFPQDVARQAALYKVLYIHL